MATEPRSRTKAISRKKKLDKESIGTLLYVDDKRILDEEVARRNDAGEDVSRSSILRDLWHANCMKERLSTEEKQPIHVILKKLLEELAATRAEVQTIGKTSKELATSHEDLLALNETEFKRIFGLASAHFNVSAQGFTLLWALLDLFQRLVADPMLARTEEHQDNPNAESTRQVHEARTEGLQLIEQFSEQHQARESLQMVLLKFDEP